MRPKYLVPLVVALCSSASAAAFAEVVNVQHKKGQSDYIFDDESLDGESASPYGDWLKVHPPPKRVLLIRPRTAFVHEMIKSVEKL